MRQFAAIILAAGLAFSSLACQSQRENPSSDGTVSEENQETIPFQAFTQTEYTEKDLAETNPRNTDANESDATEHNRILIAYFSLGRNAAYADGIDATASASLVVDGEELVGTTEYVARFIQDNVGGALYSIETRQPYSTDFDTVVDQNHEEMDQETLPPLVETDINMAEYDTIFLGYPIWAASAPRAIFSFLSQYDLSGKTIVPFCTHDGYGPGSSYQDIAGALSSQTQVLEGLALDAEAVPNGADTVAHWLQEVGIQFQTSGASQEGETAVTIAIGDATLEGILYDTPLAHEIASYFPLTISMTGFGQREYYGNVDFYPENLEGGQTTFENGHITYCEAHHNMAIFYAQTEDPILSVEVVPIGKVTSDLSIFETLPSQINVTFALDNESNIH